MVFDANTAIVVVGILSLIGSGFATYVALRTQKSTSRKVDVERDQIAKKIQDGKVGDALTFIDAFFRLYDASNGVLDITDKLLKKYPYINSGTREELETKREQIQDVMTMVRNSFND